MAPDPWTNFEPDPSEVDEQKRDEESARYYAILEEIDANEEEVSDIDADFLHSWLTCHRRFSEKEKVQIRRMAWWYLREVID